MGWLEGWDYRKSYVVSQTANAGTDYQVGIKVYYGAGEDGLETVEGVGMGKVYCDSKCKTDFGDIRFTEDDEATELPYYIEYQTDSSFAIFWVKLTDDLNADDVTIYIYYGNSGVSTTESGTNTFIVYENFDDISDWTVLYNPVVVSSDHPFKGTYGMKCSAGQSILQRIHPSAIDHCAQRMRYYDQRVATHEMHYMNARKEVSPINIISGLNETSSGAVYWYRISSTNYLSNVSRSLGFHLFETVLDGMANKKYFRIDGVEQANSASNETDIKTSHVGSSWAASKTVGYFDEFIIRKYVRPEPAWGNTGTEETPPAVGAVAGFSIVPILQGIGILK